MPNVSKVLVTSIDGQQIWVSPKQAAALEVLENSQGGGCAAVHGYIPTTNYVKPPVVDIQMLTRISYPRLLERKLEALEAVQFSDVDSSIVPDSKLKGKTREEWFEIRKQQEIDSMRKTLAGIRDDAHRQGHDRCYAHFANGVKVHLVTETNEDGIKVPVLTNGFPTADCIMVSHLELNRKVIKDGIRKIVNSGASVLMKNAIDRVLNQRSVGIRMVSLKEDNFDHLSISHNVIVPSDLV